MREKRGKKRREQRKRGKKQTAGREERIREERLAEERIESIEETRRRERWDTRQQRRGARGDIRKGREV